MKKYISLAVIALVAFAGLGLVAFADEVYWYVDVNGNLRTEVADNPTQAIATAENIHPNSGVMLTSAQVAGASISTGDNTYWYVDVNGNLRTEVAASPSAAIAGAENIHPNSGVVDDLE